MENSADPDQMASSETSYVFTIANNRLFTIDLEVKVTQNFVQYPLHHVTDAPAKFEVATTNCLGGDTITRNHTCMHTGRRAMD